MDATSQIEKQLKPGESVSLTQEGSMTKHHIEARDEHGLRAFSIGITGFELSEAEKIQQVGAVLADVRRNAAKG